MVYIIPLISEDSNIYQICYHAACGGTNDDESNPPLLSFLLHINLKLLYVYSGDTGILQSTL